MTPLQPIGYTPESVEASCRYLKTEAYHCLQSVEESLATVRTRYARLFQKLPDEIRGWRTRAEAAALPPDAADILEYQQVIGRHAETETEPELSGERAVEIAMSSVHVHSRMLPGRVAMLEYMQDRPPSFHFEVLQRMHELLTSKHPIALQGASHLPRIIADDLVAADPVIPEWHTHMRLMLHETAFMNGVTWPPSVGNALSLLQWSETENE